MVSRWVSVVSTAVLVVVLAACSALNPDPSPSADVDATRRVLVPIPDVRPAGFAEPPAGAGLARYAEQPVTWKPCGTELQCARVLVPLDYAQPDGTAITLLVAKRPATTPTRIGTLFVNPGGPGGSGANFVNGFRSPGLSGFDVIGWDPRGVGGSTPVTCFGSADLDRYNAIDGSPDDDAEQQTLLNEDRAFALSCLQRSGPLLEHISTAETVQDLDLLRGLVGAPTLDYLGFSYGTSIGSLYAQAYPDRVGRMVLDGAVDPTNGGSVTQVVGFERALDHFADWCAEQTCDLGSTRTQVLEKVAAILHGLDQKPLPGAGKRTVSQQQGVQAVFDGLYAGRPGWRGLADILAAAARGDGGPLLQAADQANSRRTNGSYGQLEYAFPAIRCLDSQAASVPKAERDYQGDEAAAPMLGALSGPDFICTQWPVASAPPPPKVVAKGAPPIVVVGSTGDPATPYEWAQAMAGQLDSGVLVTREGDGHTGYGQSDCVRKLVDSYLSAGVVPTDGVRCS